MDKGLVKCVRPCCRLDVVSSIFMAVFIYNISTYRFDWTTEMETKYAFICLYKMGTQLFLSLFRFPLDVIKKETVSQKK